jgi:small subunit ribosomal protein S17
MSATQEVQRNKRRMLEGTVTSDKMAKTITVVVERTYKHEKYKKFVRKRKKYHAHDENGEAHRGDRVEIMACRPMSRIKRWQLVRVLEKASLVADLSSDTLDPMASGAPGTSGAPAGAAPSSGGNR